MTRKVLSKLGYASLLLALFLAWQGCGIFSPDKGDDNKGGEAPPMPPKSPQDVIDNMAWAYDRLDYERYQPLIRDGFTFLFNEDDVINYPGDIPESGIWGKSEELDSAENMLDPNYIPEDPSLKIDNIQLELQFSGDLLLTNMTGDPPPPDGTLEGFVTFDLRLQTVGEIDYLVHSRPLFYFTPDTVIDGTDTTVVWSIWSIRDAPFGAPALTAEKPSGE